MASPDTPEEQASALLTASARRAVASWAGDPRVIRELHNRRPEVRTLLDQLGIEDTGTKILAAVRILGMAPSLADGTEPNPFGTWPEDRLRPALQVIARIRVSVADAVEDLNDLGVSSLSPIGVLPPYAATSDGMEFHLDHIAVLLLLWLDVPLDGRTGAEIAADLPMTSSVGWERERPVLIVGDASLPDIVAGDLLRRAYFHRSGAPELRRSDDDTSTLWRLERLAHELDSSVQQGPSRETSKAKSKSGRPRGPYVIQTRAEIERAYQDLWA